MIGDYSAAELCRILRVDDKELRSCLRAALLPASTRTRPRVYSFQNLVALRTAKGLREAGISTNRIRKVLESLKRGWELYQSDWEGHESETPVDWKTYKGMTGNEKIDLLAKLHSLGDLSSGPSEMEDHLVDLVLELRQGLREAKRFDLADHARDTLHDAGFEVQDHPDGARWSRQ